MDESPTDLEELRAIYPGAQEMHEGQIRYIHIPKLVIPSVGEVEGLLRPNGGKGDGYQTRLFLSKPVTSKGANWSSHLILDRTWHTWSRKDVLPDHGLVHVLANHLCALR